MSRSRLTIFLSALLLPSFVVIGSIYDDTSTMYRRDKVLLMLNEIRSKHDLRPLKLDLTLSKRAKKHSYRMSEVGKLFHSNLTTMLRGYDFKIAGENVGAGRRLREIIRAFMRSFEHRENILDRRFRYTGIGIVKASSVIWVTIVFYG